MTFQHSPADVLRYLLIQLGLGTAPSSGGAWPVYAADEPATPDNCITVYDTQGRDAGRIMNTGEREEYPGFQVRVRSLDHPTGALKANQIADALDTAVRLTNVTVETYTYLVYCVSRTGNVLAAGKESPTSKRKLFFINGVVRLSRTA
jgi:hypothetical protein